MFKKKNENNNTGSLRFFPPYHKCFYKIINIEDDKKTIEPITINEIDLKNNLIRDGEDFFFFMSIGIPPLNIFSLEKNIIEYEEEYRVIRGVYRDLRSLNENKEILKMQSSILEETSREDLRKQAKEYMTIVGILGAFIAFASVSVGSLKIIDTPIKFSLVSLIYLFVFSSFALLIRMNNLKKHFKYILLCLFILAGTIISILYIYKDELKNLTENEDSTKIENINTIIQEQKINQKDTAILKN
jgi:hypothetical protein